MGDSLRLGSTGLQSALGSMIVPGPGVPLARPQARGPERTVTRTGRGRWNHDGPWARANPGCAPKTLPRPHWRTHATTLAWP
eukprot:5234777-Pyramimonas_sp.AAC.1